jgi:hypothetical protein
MEPLDAAARSTHIAVSETAARLAHILGLVELTESDGYVISDKGLQALLDYSQTAESQ